MIDHRLSMIDLAKRPKSQICTGSREAWRDMLAMPIDVYDAVTKSTTSPLSGMWIAHGNKTLAFPDFTGGKWQNRQPTCALGDDY